MTYPQPERVWEVVEGFLTAAFQAAGSAIKTPFVRMDYDEAIRLYGIDKPDLRLPAFTDVRECFTAENLQELAINANLPVIALRTPKVGELSRKERDDIKPMFHSKGARRFSKISSASAISFLTRRLRSRRRLAWRRAT